MTLEYFEVYKSVYRRLVTHSMQHPSESLGRTGWGAEPEFPVSVGAHALLMARATADVQQVCKDRAPFPTSARSHQDSSRTEPSSHRPSVQHSKILHSAASFRMFLFSQKICIFGFSYVCVIKLLRSRSDTQENLKNVLIITMGSLKLLIKGTDQLRNPALDNIYVRLYCYNE